MLPFSLCLVWSHSHINWLSDWAEVETTPSVCPLKSVKNGSKFALKILLTSKFSRSFSTHASTRILQLDSAITRLLFLVLCIQQLDLLFLVWFVLYRFPIRKYHRMEIWCLCHVSWVFFFSVPFWVSSTSLPHPAPIFILQVILILFW